MNRLKKLRKENTTTQSELATILSVSEKTISRWESGESSIKSEQAQKLADFFNVSVPYLLGYSDYLDSNKIVENVHRDKEKQSLVWVESRIAVLKGEKMLRRLQVKYDDSQYKTILEVLSILQFNDMLETTFLDYVLIDNKDQQAIQTLLSSLYQKINIEK